jgi:HEAT repeat protein
VSLPPAAETRRFSAKQEQVALLLASGRSIKDVAAEGGAGERTVYCWLAEDGFRALVAELRGRLLNQAVGKLADAASAAADELRKLLADESPAIRLRAAVAILDAAVKTREHAELAEQVAELERRLAEGKDERPWA